METPPLLRKIAATKLEIPDPAASLSNSIEAPRRWPPSISSIRKLPFVKAPKRDKSGKTISEGTRGSRDSSANMSVTRGSTGGSLTFPGGRKQIHQGLVDAKKQR